MFVYELLDMCKKGYNDKKIFYIIESGKEKYKIPMSSGYYIADDIFFCEIVLSNGALFDNNSFIGMLENECENDFETWGNDIYYAPMDKIGNCELRFAKNMLSIYNNNFDDCYELLKVEELENEILIYLK